MPSTLIRVLIVETVRTTKNVCIAFILFIVALSSCKAPKYESLSAQPVDTLLKQMKSIAEGYVIKEEYQDALDYLDSVKSATGSIHNERLLSTWHLITGKVFMYKKDYDSADWHLRQAHSIASKLPEKRNVIEIKTALMNLYGRMGNFDSSLKYGLDAYKMCQGRDTVLIAEVCEKLSETYIRIGDTAMTRKYLFEAYQHSANKPDMQFGLSMNIAKYYFDIGKIDSALSFHNKMKQLDIYKNNIYYQTTSTTNVGVMLIMDGKTEEGVNYLKEAVEINRKYNFPQNFTYINLAEAYRRLGRSKQSILYADTAIIMAKESGNYIDVSNAFRTLSDNLIAQDKHEQAYTALDSSYYYYSKNDSLSYIEKAQELETMYAVRSKDEKIHSLAFENSANLKMRNQQRIILIVIIIAAILLAAVGILLWRRRQTQMRLRENNLKQQLLRAQMDPHFLFNALSILKSLIRSGDFDKAISYVSSLATIMRFNFENARENFVLLQDEVEALKAYLNLQDMYRPGLFDYSISVYEGYEDDEIFIPPMLLQPFIENAIEHGFSEIDYKGNLSIKIEKISNALHCTIEDNGKGMSQAADQKRRVYSTQINKERLSILSAQTKKPARLQIVEKTKENDGNGVRVEIDIPYRSGYQLSA